MIYIRDDDVLMASSQWPDPFARFKEVHELIKSYDFTLHIPAILTKELDNYPEAIDYIRREAEAGYMMPEYHGSKHIDYANLTPEEIFQDYKQGQDWFISHFGFKFNKHYTPWGAGADARGAHIGPTAAASGIVMVTCESLLEPEHILADESASRNKYEDKEIFIHWWAGIGRLQRALDKLR